MTNRGRIIGYGLAALLVLLGAVGAAVAGGGGQLLALVLIGLGLVLATSLVFFEVGLSEDRERASELEAARRREQDTDATRRRSGTPPRSRPRPRLERMRGRLRRWSCTTPPSLSHPPIARATPRWWCCWCRRRSPSGRAPGR